MEEIEDSAVDRARSGDREAFRMLVDTHSRSVFRLAFRMTGNEQDAEDVVQETFLRAYRQLKNFQAKASFSTWLFRIAANYSLDLIRRRKRRQELSPMGRPNGDTDLLQSVPSDRPTPDRLVLSGQFKERLDSAMDELSAQERTAFVLRHFEGLSIEDIGASLGTNGNATKHSIFRAVQKLRHSLAPFVSVT